MGRWKVEYYSSGWVEKTDATVSEVMAELNGHEEATFLIPNTSSNRTFVTTDQIVRIKFDTVQRFLGALFGVEYSLTRLKCIVYNGVYELLKRRVISGNYVNIPANVVAEAVRVAAGLINPLGSCPTTPICVSFDQTFCFDAIELIANILNKDYWTVNGDTLYIGTRGSSQSFDGAIAKISMRGLDRSKKRDKVHVRGISESGEQIMGFSGTGDNVAVFWCHTATTIAALNAIAAQKLAEVNSDDSGIPLICPITSGVQLYPGDTITVNKPELNLSGSYRIRKTTKYRKTVDIEVSRKKKGTEDILDELLKKSDDAANLGTLIYGDRGIENMRINPNLISGTLVKGTNNLVTTYLKESCIPAGDVAVAAPTGNMNSYEAGYICKALIFKNGTGERTLAKAILDLWASLQNADGSWYQQYNPYLNAAGVHEKVTWIAPGVSGDLKVDSGAAMLACAMSEYDAIGSTTIYKAVVQKALGFLRDLQYAHQVAHGTGLIANLIQDGVIDTMAFSADSSECLLAMTAALTTYGDPLLTTSGYNVKTMANDVYYYLCVSTWTGDAGRYYATTYPIGMGGFQEKISFTQALCSWANYVFGTSAFRTVTDFTSQAEKCLDFITTLTAGQWGGQMYNPYTGAAGETQDEFAGYTSLMALAMNAVNASKYAPQIALSINFLKWLALSDGRIYDRVEKTGALWISKVGTEEAYGFLSLSVAQALLAGA